MAERIRKARSETETRTLLDAELAALTEKYGFTSAALISFPGNNRVLVNTYGAPNMQVAASVCDHIAAGTDFAVAGSEKSGTA